MPRAWRKEQSQDPFFRRAKAEGYRARSAYKLQEIDQRFRLLRPGAIVLDLGAAPGSWSQLASKVLGRNGRVVAVDIQAMDPLPGVEIIQGDINEPAVQTALGDSLPGGADVVLSDVSPRISGIAVADQARSIELAESSLAIARRYLKPGGAFVVKVFQGGEFGAFVQEAKRHFELVHVVQPAASRKESDERYVVGLRLKASAKA